MNKLKNLRDITLVALLSTTFAVSETQKNVWTIIHQNDWTSFWWQNDMWQSTGLLKVRYKKENYKIEAKWRWYVNWDPDDKLTTRTNPNNKRIDAFYISYIEWEKLKYWAWIEVLWNLWFADVQNWIHKVVWDSYIPAEYNPWYRITPTFNFEYNDKLFDDYLDLNIEWKLPLIPDNWIIEFSTMVSKTASDILDTWVNLWLWAWIDCKRYPNIPAFWGYPVKDYKTCTPETKLTIWYKENINIFMKVPLINNNIQNTQFWIEYNF